LLFDCNFLNIFGDGENDSDAAEISRIGAVGDFSSGFGSLDTPGLIGDLIVFPQAPPIVRDSIDVESKSLTWFLNTCRAKI